MRHYDKNTNKFKEDVKQENFKKHIIGTHMRQQLQVKEKQLNRHLLKNLQQNNNTFVASQNTLYSQYLGYVTSKRNYNSDVANNILSRLKPSQIES